jgi:hypothetical protein
MTPSTRPEPEDRRAVCGKAIATIHCGLCQEAILLESSFRPTPTVCPHCGLKFTFDPQKQPLPVRGMRLNWTEAAAAQRGGVLHRRHDAHLSSHVALPPVKNPSVSRYLAWAGTLAITFAGMLALLNWLRR